MRDPRETTLFETHPTDDVAEVTGLLWVPESKIFASTLLTPGTTLRSFMASSLISKSDALTRGFGDYLLTASAGRQEGYLGYFFAKPKTDTEKETPYRSTPDVRVVGWPAVLLNLHGGLSQRKLDSESGMSGADAQSNTVIRYEFEDRYQVIPAVRHPTEILVEEFQSPTAWEALEADAPVPTQVRYFYKGTQMSFDGLHDDVTVPEQSRAFQREYEFGTPSAQSLPAGQFFPATVPTRWLPYTLSDTQRFVNGVYRRTRERVLRVPPLPKALKF